MPSMPVPRAARERPVENRGSMLRASILESAIELGVGSGGTVARWMFSPVEEGDEDVDAGSATSPSLTYASTATSEDSFLSNSLSPRPQPRAGASPSPAKPTVATDLSSYVSREGLSPINEGVQRIQFDFSVSPEPRVVSPAPPTGLGGRFRRLRLNINDEGDGGYISDGSKGKKEKKKKKGKDDASGTEYESDGGYFSEASRMRRKKTKKDKKAKTADSPTTDYETDGGAVGRSKSKKSRTRKTSVSAGTGDESDGGNMSESSAKRKGFFRLNTRSRKKREGDDTLAQKVPPVPALPTMPLPIADRFLRSPTPNMSDLTRTMSDLSQTTTDTSQTVSDLSRTLTPVASLLSTTDEASILSSTSAEHDAGSIIAREGLTQAFGDAKSIHRPSYDVLATFRNVSPAPLVPNLPDGAPAIPSPLPSPRARGHNSPVKSSRSPSRSRGERPVISAPNTTMLNTKHVPAPLVLSSATSVRSQAAVHYPHSPGSDYVTITPQATPTPDQTIENASLVSSNAGRPDSELDLPSPSTRGSDPKPPNPKVGQSNLRPQVLAYYGIPPPTPPPQGPLPDVPPSVPSAPSELSRTVSADDMRARSPLARSPLSASRTGAPSRALPLTPMSAPVHPARSASDSNVRSALPPDTAMSVPVISEPIPRTQRGRVSPFPILPARSLSPMFPHSRSPAAMTPTSTSSAASAHAERIARYVANKPMSADGYSPPSGARHDPERLDTQWAPRSASRFERPDSVVVDAPLARKVSFEDERPSLEYEDEYAEERSELFMDDDSEEGDMEPLAEDDRSFYPEDDDQSHYEESRPGTAYTDADGGDRYSMWSQSDERRSLFDEEKSASTRERFVKQVEKMYGEYKVPPVPALNARQLSRGVTG